MGRPKLNDNGTPNGTLSDKVENEKWTSHMDIVLIDALVHENDTGNRVNGTFTSTTYDNVVKELTEKLRRELKKDHVKNRLKTIKNFNECYDIFKGGIAWSPLTKMRDAEPEVWNSLFEAKPEAKKWMSTPVPNYEKLLRLFGKDRATGADAETAKEKARR